ncbi:I17RC protein, partial [Todus mexicanus]|nr:I17RC protein [Todus mexicanus]
HRSPDAAADAQAWERLWAHSRLVLHGTGQALSCSLSAPCDIPAELVPCWQPVPAGPCQALPGLQQPAVGQGPQEFGRLRLHPNLCVQVGHPLAAPRLPHGQPQALTRSLGQVWSGGQVRLTQCLRDREYCWGGRTRAARGSGWGAEPPGLPSPTPKPPCTSSEAPPGSPDDILLIEFGGSANASLCALERDGCTPLASFTSTLSSAPLQGAGRPGLLEQELRRDVAAGHCRQVSAGSGRAAGRDRAGCDVCPCPQIWHPENSSDTTLWACPLHKYLRTRWVLAWMGVLLGTACLLLLLLLLKEDVKGEWCLSGGCTWPETPPGFPSLPLLPAGWLKSLRAGYGSEGE